MAREEIAALVGRPVAEVRRAQSRRPGANPGTANVSRAHADDLPAPEAVDSPNGCWGLLRIEHVIHLTVRAG